MLTGRIDAAESELKTSRFAGAGNYDVTSDMHQMTAQLMAEKETLQARIAQQLAQIEALNGEVRELRSEVAELTRQVRDGSEGEKGGASGARRQPSFDEGSQHRR